MIVTTQADFIWSDKQSRYILVRSRGYDYCGEWGLLKGATAAQNNLANQQAGFYSTLQQDYNTQFANQNAILGSLNKSLAPILQAGPNQFGFSAAQTQNMNATAVQGTGQQYASAKKGLDSQQAAAGGGNAVLPSGVASQQQANLASAGANQASSELMGIQNAGYAQGNAMYNNAVGQLSGVAGLYNANGTAGAANSAGSAAGNTMAEIAQENQAANPMNAILGGLGGIASAYAGGLGRASGYSAGRSAMSGSGNYGMPEGDEG